MAEKIVERRSASVVLNDFILKNRKIILGVFGVAFIAIIAYCVVFVVSSKATENGLAEIDSITNTLTASSSTISEEDLVARKDAALNNLSSYVTKGGIVGVRANMLSADIYFQNKDFEKARSAWLAAASKGKKAYTAPLAYFNAAVCSEELNDLDGAISYYETASKFEDFFEADHALFSLARVQEEKQDFAVAGSTYQSLIDKSPEVSWAKLAKTRMIALKNDGKIE